ncbi:MAG: signal transduction histidine kinase [Cyclobacteriaceae bacterium]|jgi:signal transduction histidine kinase
MKHTLMLFFSLSFLLSHGQPQFDNLDLDSLNLVLSEAKEDSNKVKTLLLMHDKFRLSDFPKAVDLAGKAYNLSKKIGWNAGIARSANVHGVALSLTGLGDEASEVMSEAVVYARMVGDTATEANCYMTLGNIQYDKSAYSEALVYYFQCLAAYKSINNQAGMSSALIWIGIIYQYAQKDYDMAIATYNDAMKAAKLGNANLNLGYITSNLATIYYEKGQYDSALVYYEKGVVIKKKYNDTRGLANAYNNMANCHYEMANFSESLSLYEESYQTRLSLQDSTGIATSLVNMGKVYEKLGQPNSAEDFIKRGKSIAFRIEFKEVIQQASLLLSQLAESKGDFEVALSEYKAYKQVSDSIFNVINDETISELKTKYETEKKEQQIALQQLELSEKQAENQRNLVIIGGLIAVVLFLLIISLLIRSRSRKKQALLVKEAEVILRETQIEAALNSQETERKRFARDLHDGFGQMISVLNLNLKSLEKGEPDREQVFQNSSKVLDDMYKELKGICFNLMPETLIKNGVVDAIKEFSNRVNQTGKIVITVDTFGITDRLSDLQEISIYRITQEWINNMLKYSDADKVTISLTKDEEEITLLIEDNGQGFDKEQLTNGSGNGWKNMNSRANLIKGELELETTKGVKGNTLIVNAPVRLISSVVKDEIPV